jgi:hypothetical protein
MASDSSWTVVARMGNLAEVGYFADILEAQDIATRVHHRHEFSALDGIWETFYELQVPGELAESAVGTLRQELTHEDDGGHDDFLASQATRPPMFRPLLWAAVAGGIAYWAGRSGVGMLPLPPDPPDTLWHVVSESAPFWSEPRDGEPRRCLRFDEQTSSMVVEEHFDADGIPERLLRIGAVR